MELFTMVVTSEDGLVALSSVTLAIAMLAGTFSMLAYKSGQRAVKSESTDRKPS